MLTYCATNKINGKKYIGQTTNTLEQRINGHRKRMKSNCKTVFYDALRSYSFENYMWEEKDYANEWDTLHEKES